MLDNPNLSLEKTFEMIAHAKDIFAVAIIMAVAILLYIYRYQIRLFIKYGLSANKKNLTYSGILGLLKTDFLELEKRDLNDKIAKLLDESNKSTFNEEYDIQLQNDIFEPSSTYAHTPPNFSFA